MDDLKTDQSNTRNTSWGVPLTVGSLVLAAFGASRFIGCREESPDAYSPNQERDLLKASPSHTGAPPSNNELRYTSEGNRIEASLTEPVSVQSEIPKEESVLTLFSPLSVRVVSESGDALSQASVWAKTNAGHSLGFGQTNEDGMFRFEGKQFKEFVDKLTGPALLNIVARCNEFVSASGQIEYYPQGENALTLKLMRGKSIEASIVDARTKSPIPGAQLMLLTQPGSVSAGTANETGRVISTRGEILLSGIPEEAKSVQYWAEAQGYIRVDGQLDCSKSLSEYTLELKRGNSIAYRLVDATSNRNIFPIDSKITVVPKLSDGSSATYGRYEDEKSEDIIDGLDFEQIAGFVISADAEEKKYSKTFLPINQFTNYEDTGEVTTIFLSPVQVMMRLRLQDAKTDAPLDAAAFIFEYEYKDWKGKIIKDQTLESRESSDPKNGVFEFSNGEDAFPYGVTSIRLAGICRVKKYEGGMSASSDDRYIVTLPAGGLVEALEVWNSELLNTQPLTHNFRLASP